MYFVVTILLSELAYEVSSQVIIRLPMSASVKQFTAHATQLQVTIKAGCAEACTHLRKLLLNCHTKILILAVKSLPLP